MQDPSNAVVKRNRVIYCALLAITIALGLGSRKFGDALPAFIAEYAGDTLWALAGFLIVGILRPRWPTWRVALVAGLFGLAIELSQLYHAPWIERIRHTIFGALVLGYGFLWSDLACYAVGVALGILGEMTLIFRKPVISRKSQADASQ